MKILIEAKPYKDESFISWFCRTAFLNGSDPKSFALSVWKQNSMFYKDLDRFIPEENIYQITKLSTLSKKEIKKLTLEPLIDEVNTSKTKNLYKKWYFLLPLAQKGKIRTNGIHFCPECLKFKTPYINKYWRLSWFIICPIHKKQLILNCPKCNQVFSPEKQDYKYSKIYLCSSCKYDLRKIKLKVVGDDFLIFQNKISNIFSNKKTNFTFKLLVTESKKDLFLTLNILLSFVYKVIRQNKRFNSLIKSLEIEEIKYSFKQINNATFSRLNSYDRKLLLSMSSKLLNYETSRFITILKDNGITQNIFQQTFKTLSPTVIYIIKHLSNKKLIRKNNKIKHIILPKSKEEVQKLFNDIKPYLKSDVPRYNKNESLRNKLEDNDKKKYIFNNFSYYIKDKVNSKILSSSYSQKILNCTFNYLVYCNNFKNRIPTQSSLEGYLWIHFQNKYYLNFFIKYLFDTYKITLDIKKIKKTTFLRPKKSHQILKERVTYILNHPKDKHLTQKYIIDALIGYFHWIHVPSNVFINANDITIKNYEKSFFRISNHIFDIPIKAIDTIQNNLYN